MGFGINPHINKVSNNTKIIIKINGLQANPHNFIKHKNKYIITKLRKIKLKEIDKKINGWVLK